MAVDRRVDQHACPIQDRPMNCVNTSDASGIEPCEPRCVVAKMQEGPLEHVTGPAKVGSKSRAAYREQLLGAQACNMQTRPMTISMTDRDIDVLAGKVDMMHR